MHIYQKCLIFANITSYNKPFIEHLTFYNMKKVIRIFVAGAKDLQSERNALKALAHDLNTHYEDRHIGIFLKIKSYEDFKDNQNEYNDYIENFADVVIFVLKDGIGIHTEEEFIMASNAFSRKKHPEIIVFINKNRQNNNVEEKMQKLMQEHLNNHYFVEYADDDDLKAEARKRIDRYVRPTFQMNSRAGKWTIATLFCLMLLFAGLFVWSNYFKEKEEQRLNGDKNSPSLLFAGGGSVIEFIHQECVKDKAFLINYPNSICEYIASKNAWRLLSEEVNRSFYQGGNNNLNYRTICLSADSIPADSSTFLNEISSCPLKKMGDECRIVECYLGEDPLIVYVHKDFFEKNKEYLEKVANSHKGDSLYIITNKDKYISTVLLSRILLDNEKKSPKDKIHIFSTSYTSGTAYVYQQNLDNVNFKDMFDARHQSDYNISIFNEISLFNDLASESNSNLIVLGSKYYHFKIDDNEKDEEQDTYYMYYVKKDNQIISKPLYLYFVAFFKDVAKATLDIPVPIYEFLEKIYQNGEKEVQEKLKKCKDDGYTINRNNEKVPTRMIIPFIKKKN